MPVEPIPTLEELLDQIISSDGTNEYAEISFAKYIKLLVQEKEENSNKD